MPFPHRDAVALSARTLGALFSYAPNNAQIAPLVAALQSGSFADPPLLPIRVHQCISATENRVVLEVENARYFRLKNHEPEAIIQRGGSQWMVFPWLRKDGTVTGDVSVATHSGTFGWAVRYEGP